MQEDRDALVPDWEQSLHSAAAFSCFFPPELLGGGEGERKVMF